MERVGDVEPRKVTARAWLLQLTPINVERKTDEPVTLKLSGSGKHSQVTSFTVYHTEATKNMREAIKNKTGLVASLASGLPSRVKSPILDIWRLETPNDVIKGLVRISDTSLHDLFKVSGLQGTCFDSPRGSESYHLVWLKVKKDHKYVPMAYEEVRKAMQEYEVHLGLIRSKDAWALRVEATKFEDARKALQSDRAPAWKLVGVPLELQDADITELLLRMQWNAAVIAGSRRAFKGRAQWLVRAVAAPSTLTFPFASGDMRALIQVEDSKKLVKEPVSHESKIAEGSRSWREALIGKELPASAALVAMDPDDSEDQHDKDENMATDHDEQTWEETRAARPAKRNRSASWIEDDHDGLEEIWHKQEAAEMEMNRVTAELCEMKLFLQQMVAKMQTQVPAPAASASEATQS